MNIEDLIQLLNNRLKEFKLSRDYATMSGDLERMNAADKEIISLEDTLFKLNLLIDTSKSAAVKENTLAEVITDGSVAVLGEYDITPYATDPLHEEKIMNILSKMGVMDTAEKIDDYIKDKYWSSPVTGEMIMNAASAYSVDARLMMAIMEQDSRFGTAGVAVRTLNPGNVGNNDAGDTVTYESWQEGVTAVARWLSRHRVSTIISEIPDTATSTPSAATSIPPIIIPTATTTTSTTISTPMAATSTSSGQATSIPPIIIPTATTTISTTTSTPSAATSTPASATSAPAAATSTPPIVTPAATTTTSTTISTPTTATSTPEAATPVVGSSATTTGQASTPETIPVTTSTATTTTAISTPTTATTTPMAATSTPEIPPITTSTATTTTATSAE